MGPWDEMVQLERLARVRQLLERNDLSDWARNYWQSVYDRISRDEERYNARVVSIFTEIRNRQTRNWL